MIVDVNAYLGHFAFRRLRHNTAASLLALMDVKKIDRAVVSNVGAITYRNSQAGNEEVAEEVQSSRPIDSVRRHQSVLCRLAG